MEPILIVPCEEPKGIVEHAVYPFVFSEENIQKFWSQAKKYPHIFGKSTAGNIEDFLNMFFYLDDSGFWQTNNLFFVVDDFTGILSLTNIYHPYDGLMHFVFYDGRLRGRENIIREIISYVMTTYDFNRLSAEVPMWASKGVLKFISDRVGLKLEGRRRKSIPSPYPENAGELFDVLLYGVTKKDIEEWDNQEHRLLVAETQAQ